MMLKARFWITQVLHALNISLHLAYIQAKYSQM